LLTIIGNSFPTLAAPSSHLHPLHHHQQQTRHNYNKPTRTPQKQTKNSGQQSSSGGSEGDYKLVPHEVIFAEQIHIIKCAVMLAILHLSAISA